MTIHEVQDAEGAPFEPSERGTVLLLGDSFTNVFSLEPMGWGESAGLAPHLARGARPRRRRDRAERRRRATPPGGCCATRWRAARIAWQASAWSSGSSPRASSPSATGKPIDWSRAPHAGRPADERPGAGDRRRRRGGHGGSCDGWRARAGGCAAWCSRRSVARAARRNWAARLRRATSATGHRSAPRCEGVEAVFHLAAVILARDPARLRRGQPRRHRQHGRRRRGRAACATSSTSRRRRWSTRASRPTGVSSWTPRHIVAAERRFAHTIVRPTLVYDETGGAGVPLLPRLPAPLPGGAVHRPRLARASARSSPRTSSTDSRRIVGNPVGFGKTYNLSGREAITLRELGALILGCDGGAERRSCTCRCRCAGRSPPRSRACMKNPPLTPYAIAGFINDADLDAAKRSPTSATPRAACAPVSPIASRKEPT